MKLVKKYPVLGSSVDPEKISLTIKSVGLMIIPIVVALSKAMGYEIAENDLVQALTILAGIVSSIGVLYGLIRKYINAKP